MKFSSQCSAEMIKLCVVSMLLPIVILYEQHDYIVGTQRAAVINYDNPYGNESIKFFKFNRTYTALNFTLTIKSDLSSPVKVDIQAYKFASNEYRLFPLTLSVDLCSTLADNTYGIQNFYDCGNFTGCPLKKGSYVICNWGPDYSKFPPYMPHGEFRMDYTFVYKSKQIFTMEWYVKVQSAGLF